MPTQTQPKVEAVEYRTFPVGHYNIQMREVVSWGRPGNMADVMKGIVSGGLLLNDRYCTVDGIAYTRGAGLKIVLDSPQLIGITPETKLYREGIKLTQEQYDKIPEQEFRGEDMPLSRDLTEEEVLEHPGWLRLARENKELLGNFSHRVFKQVRDRFGKTQAMGLYIEKQALGPYLEKELQEVVPSLRALYFSNNCIGSYANVYLITHPNDVSLFGVRESAKGAPQISVPSLEHVIMTAEGYVGPKA